MRILVINPGTTSTKISIFEEDQEVFSRNIKHSREDLLPFPHVLDQLEYRKILILRTLFENGYSLSCFSAVCGRGGLLRHIPSGTYAVSDRVLEDVKNPPHGEHASNLGPILAREIGDAAGVPSYFTDPVSVDEMTDTARVSGFKGIERESFFHALNQKSMARKAARQLGRSYEDLNLIVVHMGGGVSVAAHQKGKAVDVFDVKDDGSFGMDRGGSLPVHAVIEECFSGKTKAELKKIFSSESGVYSYLGTKDFRTVERRAAAGDPEAGLIFDAMAYQLSKDIGAMAAVLRFDVNAIVLTGGIANSADMCGAIQSYVDKLAPILIFPGEEEMRALAEGALRVLRGEPAGEY